jgi:hypothetical protein
VAKRDVVGDIAKLAVHRSEQHGIDRTIFNRYAIGLQGRTKSIDDHVFNPPYSNWAAS